MFQSLSGYNSVLLIAKYEYSLYVGYTCPAHNILNRNRYFSCNKFITACTFEYLHALLVCRIILLVIFHQQSSTKTNYFQVVRFLIIKLLVTLIYIYNKGFGRNAIYTSSMYIFNLSYVILVNVVGFITIMKEYDDIVLDSR